MTTMVDKWVGCVERVANQSDGFSNGSLDELTAAAFRHLRAAQQALASEQPSYIVDYDEARLQELRDRYQPDEFEWPPDTDAS